YHADRWEGPWIGPSAPHDAGPILDTVGSNDECVCGSGRRYGVCHRRVHLAMCRAGQHALG
ncbi:MAG: SEC-C metal-binding domain-containing protein, partial [Candidatus Sulfotelmatobacter sp.]